MIARLDVPRGNVIDGDPRSRGEATVGEGAQPRLTSRNDGLDLIRAIAAALVFGTHAWIGYGMHFLGPFAEAGWLGVYIFFPLSGFLLYRPILSGSVDLRAYALSRAGRMLPAYYLAFAGLAILGVVPGLLANPLPTLTLTGNVFDLQGIEASGFGQSWTIGVEVLFYVALPLIAFLAAPRPWLLFGLVAASYGVFTATSDHWAIEQFPLLFWSFGAGMLVARYLDRLAIAARLWPVGVGLIAWAELVSPGTDFPARQVVTFGAAWLIAAAAILRPRIPFARLPADLSYSVYLWHAGLLLAVARTGLSGLALLVPALIGSVAVAYVSLRLIERPALERAHALGRNQEDRQARPIVAAERSIST